MIELGTDLDFTQEPLGTDRGSELGAHDLDGYLAVMLEILREVDSGHPTATKFPLDGVTVGEGCLEAIKRVSHA
jgi:hypothetical protein